MITPPYLKSGDKIGIVTPSCKIEKGALEKAIGYFKDWGLKVGTGSNVYAGYNQFGGTDQERASDLQLMLDDDEIKAIMCSRGGYGTVRLIDRIDFNRFISNPKWIVGYSDISVIHSHVNKNFGIETMHAPMPVEFSPASKSPISGRSLNLLKDALFGTLPEYYNPNHRLSRKGKAEGVLTGGNLSVLYSLLGSSSAIDTRGKILFIEDVGEYLYHIDRMMIAMRRNGVLEGAGGLLVGGMTGMNDNRVPFGKTAEEIVAEVVEEFDYPVWFGFPAGHQPENSPLVLGRNAILSVGDSNSRLVFS